MPAAGGIFVLVFASTFLPAGGHFLFFAHVATLPAMSRKPSTAPPRAKTPKKPPGGLSPLELHALAIAGKEATKWRELLIAGPDQAVDVIVRINGTVSVGEDQLAIKRSYPKLEDVLAIVLDALTPKTRAKAHAALLAVYPMPSRPELSREAQVLAKSALEALTPTEEQHKFGNVAGKLAVARAG